jgi:dsDNA-specific endonuclease/ATPase MutS2
MSLWRRLFGPRAREPHDPVQPEDEVDEAIPETVQIPIDGVLDLHVFRPAEVAEVVAAYVAECRARGIHELRIIHGKGKGVLRRTVHATLGRLPEVERFALAGAEAGGWGATLVTLKPGGR